MSMFRGRLFAGSLYAGVLFGASPETPPAPGGWQASYYGASADAPDDSRRIRQQNNMIITMLASMAAQGAFQ